MKSVIIKFLLLISITCISGQRRAKLQAGKPTKSKECEKDKFDEQVSNVFAQFGLEELKFPESRTELDTYCKKAKSANEYAKTYGQQCLKGTSSTLMSLAVYNFERTNKQYCSKNGKLKDQFVTWAKCGNNGRGGTEKCWKDMVLKMANTRKVKNAKIRIPIICCSYYEWIKCTMKSLKDAGSSICPQSSIDGYDQHIRKATVDAMNLICRRYEDNDEKCNKYYEELPKNKIKNIRKTPMLYVFEVFDSL